MKNKFFESALNLLFPPVCGICGKLNKSYICNQCNNILKGKEKNTLNFYHDKCFKTHFWVYEYKDEIRKCLIDYKFNDKSYLYRTLVELILNNKKAVEYIKRFDIIIPVPIHKRRLKQRGYNQCELIAKAICKQIPCIELANKVIIKQKNIVPQSSLNKEERAKNIKDAYAINYQTANKYNLLNKKILIIDDIYTTGSTATECARTIKNLIFENIGILTIAKD